MEKEIGYRFQEPSDKTCKFMDNQTKFNTNIEVTMKGLTKDLGYIKETLDTHIQDQKDHDKIVEKQLEEAKKLMVDFIDSANEKYADAEQFRFWRNLLIAGILISIAVGIIGIIVDKLLH
jgi:hypothetical protein